MRQCRFRATKVTRRVNGDGLCSKAKNRGVTAVFSVDSSDPFADSVKDPVEEEGTLSPGTRLGEFEIRGLIGVGGFGIVYRAFDHDLEREVAIKEYMPGLLATRTRDGAVQARGRSHADTFDAGLRSFMNEARMLARFDHPALVKVFRYWEGNGTAYMVMPLYLGQTLSQALRQLSAPPDEAWLMGILVPLLGALDALHGQQIFHRDVSPDNILLLRNGRPVLLDFGAARQVISDRTQTLTAILKPNYAPIEQYAEVANLRQGPWTDLYALGAVVYASLTGKPPPPAAARTVQDELVPLADIAARLQAEHGLRYSAAFLDAWQAALAVRPGDRPQSVRDLLQRLGLMPSTAGFDSEATIVIPAAGAGSGLPDDGERTIVVTGLQMPAPRPAVPIPPPAVSLPTGPVAPVPTGGTPRTPPPYRTASPTTGRDMRIIPPGATAQPAVTPVPPPELLAPTVIVAPTLTTATPAVTVSPAAAPAPAPGTPPPTSAPPAAPAQSPAPARRRLVDPLLGSLAAGAVVILGALYALNRSYAPDVALPTAPTSAAPASVAAAEPASVPASAMAVTARAAASAPPEHASTPAPAVTAAAGTAAATAASTVATAASRPDRAALQAARASAAAAAKAASAAGAGGKAAAASTPTTSPAPTDRSAGPGRPAGNASSAEATSPPPAPPASPDELCAKRNVLTRDACIQEVCQRADLARHPTCAEMRHRQDEERRRDLYRG